MTDYRVSIWASVNVTADNEEEACGLAHDMVLNQDIKMRDYEFDAQARD